MTFRQPLDTAVFLKNSELVCKMIDMHGQADFWYYNNAVQWEIFKMTKDDREMAFLSPSWVNVDELRGFQYRAMHNYSVQGLDYNFKNKFTGFPTAANAHLVYNVFYSMAKFKGGVPTFHNKDEAEEWKKIAWKSIYSYDLLVDIDAPSHKHMGFALESCFHVKSIFDKYDIPYDIRFTGKGFHIVVPGTAVQFEHFEPRKEGSAYGKAADVLRYLHDVVGEFIDFGIADSRRVCKVPYSLAFYENDFAVCWPLTLKEMNHFNYKDFMNQNAVGLLPSIKNRGLFMFNKENENDTSCFEEFYKNEVMPYREKKKNSSR